MITREEKVLPEQTVEAVPNFTPVLTDKAGVIARSDTGIEPEPEIISGAQLLEAAAAQSAEIAAAFIRQSNRSAGRAHLKRALEQLNEAEIED